MAATISATGGMGLRLVVHDAGSELTPTMTLSPPRAADPATGRGSYGLYNGPFGGSVAGGVAKVPTCRSTRCTLMYGVYTNTGGMDDATEPASDRRPLPGAPLGQWRNHQRDRRLDRHDRRRRLRCRGQSRRRDLAQRDHGHGDRSGSGGLGIDGAASTLNATGVTISTMGGHDPVSGQNAYAVYNGPYRDSLSGGTASLANSSVATSGAEMVGVYTTTGGTTTLTGTSVATAGLGAHGVESLAASPTSAAARRRPRARTRTRST